MTRFFWLCELTVAGRVLRYSTQALEVLDARGVSLEYSQGLGELEMGQSDPSADILILDPATDWAALSESLVWMPVVVRRWREGDILEQAEVFSRGAAMDVEHGAQGEALEFTVADEGQAEQLAMPDTDAVVKAATAPDDLGTMKIPDGQHGRFYPVVFGAPGRAPELRADGRPFPVVPCPIRQYPDPFGLFADAITITTVVVSEDPEACNPSTVQLRDADSITEFEQSCFVISDNLGRRIVVADFSLNFDQLLAGDHGDVLAGYDRGPGTRRLYEVLVYVLRRWGGDTVDWQRLPEIREFLDGYFVDTWVVDDVGDVWEWLEDVFLDTVPLAVRTSSRGRYFVPLYFAVDPRRTTRTLEVGLEVSRVDPVTWEGDPVNELTVQFRDTGDEFMSSTTLGAGPQVNVQHRLCIISQSRYGRRVARADDRGLPVASVQVSWTWDPGTAGLVAEWMVQRDALPYRILRYRVPEDLGLRESDQVRLVDAELGLDELCIVEGPPLVDVAGVTVTLRIPGR